MRNEKIKIMEVFDSSKKKKLPLILSQQNLKNKNLPKETQKSTHNET